MGLAIGAAAATAALAQPAAPSSTPRAAGGAAQVLVITGSDPYLPAFVAIDAAMRQVVARSQHRVQWMYESFDTLRFASVPGEQLAEILARKYEGIRIDAVVLVTESPADFYLQHGLRLWPRTPVIVNSVAPEFARTLPTDADVAVVPFEVDYEGTLRIAFALQPQARRMMVIAGTSAFDQTQLATAHRALQKLAGRAEIEYLVGQDVRTVRERLARESPATIALYLSVFLDASGRIYVPRDFVQEIASASRTPLYGAIDTFMGVGVVAGSIEPFRARGQITGELLLKALDGKASGGPTALPAPPSSCVADARQLARFDLAQRLLPEGCEIRFLEPTFLQRYWWQTMLVLLALGAQSGLIVALLLQRRRRRAAELGYASQRVQLLHASRLAVAGELTASIAHEINQPLAAILSNADAAELLVQSGRLERGELLQILADIKRDDLRASEVIKRLRTLLARHEVEHRRFDLHRAIADSVAILRAESRRRAATIETDLQARASKVTGDPIQIQQVLINLILNAFDAVDGRAPGDRRVRVSTADVAGGVQIRVRDFGHGIAPADLPRLFDSFFTKKAGGMGLGLSIARSIVEAHGGTISTSNCDVGAEFCVTLLVAPAADETQQPIPETP